MCLPSFRSKRPPSTSTTSQTWRRIWKINLTRDPTHDPIPPLLLRLVQMRVGASDERLHRVVGVERRGTNADRGAQRLAVVFERRRLDLRADALAKRGSVIE